MLLRLSLGFVSQWGSMTRLNWLRNLSPIDGVAAVIACLALVGVVWWAGCVVSNRADQFEDERELAAKAAKQRGKSYAREAQNKQIADCAFCLWNMAGPLLLLFVGCLASWRMLMSTSRRAAATRPLSVSRLLR